TPSCMTDGLVTGKDLRWEAPWIDVNIWVELPFWLMVSNTTVALNVEGHEFQVAVHDNYFELYGGALTDSRVTVCYRGPLKELYDLSGELKEVRRDNPTFPFMWRKCKTVLKIATRCNEEVWKAAIGGNKPRKPSVEFYLAVLCKAHIP